MADDQSQPKRWTYGEVCGRLRELEREKDLLDRHRCLGWSVWPVIRTHVGFRMCRIKVDRAEKSSEGGAGLEGLAIVWDGLRLLVRAGSFRGKLVTMSSSSEWRVPSDRGMVSIYFGDLPGMLTDHRAIEWLNQPNALMGGLGTMRMLPYRFRNRLLRYIERKKFAFEPH